MGRIYAGIVVAPEARRSGIGSALLTKTLLQMKKQGLRYGVVETIPGITASKYLYQNSEEEM
ncbi:MAG TPA: GNAT family N-acetyltransferase [Candidatus Bathyarchaeia archaeon]